MDIRYFDEIKVNPPRQRIYNRLGYRTGKTILTPRGRKILEESIEEGLFLIDIRGAALRSKIVKSGNKITEIKAGVSFHSKALEDFLSGCEEVLLMGVTAGKKITDTIKILSRERELNRAVIYDAFASETVDKGLTWIMEFFQQELIRENKSLTTRRFSAGYKDLGLENQKVIYDILDMSKLGVRITKSFLLKPEKTLTAIAGIKEIGS
jgi:hypothetical protein